jgi:hypothetical protein
MFDVADMHRLLSQPDADRTLSLYLTTDAARLENHATTPGWRIWAKNALHSLAATHKDDPAFASLCKRAEEILQQRADSKGLAVFLTPSSEQVLALPVPLEGNAASYGRAVLTPLLFLLDEYRRTLIVGVDKEQARMVSGYMGGASREGSHANDFSTYDFPEKTQMPNGLRTMGGSNRDAFAATEQDHRRRFLQEVAADTRRLVGELRVERVFLAGSEEAAHALKKELHPEVAKLVVAVVPVPHWVDDGELVRRVLPVATEAERARESALIDEVIDFAKSGGRGALGQFEVEACLERKQVELLLLPWPTADMELHDRLARDAMAAGATVELVSGDAARRIVEEGGVAARLFYPTPAELRPDVPAGQQDVRHGLVA